MMSLTLFNELFNRKYTDDFGYHPTWDNEVEKWLSFVFSRNKVYYQNRTKDLQPREKIDPRENVTRDAFLGECKASYFIEKVSGGRIIEFEPKGSGDKLLEFRFLDNDDSEWFTEVKSPSWHSQVVKEVETEYLKMVRGPGVQIHFDLKNPSQTIASIKCLNCKNDIDFYLERTESLSDDRLKEAKCCICKKHFWKDTAKERIRKINQRLLQDQIQNGEARSFNGGEGVEEAIKKCVSGGKFDKGKNNLLAVTPNMFAPSALIMAGFDGGYKIRQLLEELDKEKLITCVLILKPYITGIEVKYNHKFVSRSNQMPVWS